MRSAFAGKVFQGIKGKFDVLHRAQSCRKQKDNCAFGNTEVFSAPRGSGREHDPLGNNRNPGWTTTPGSQPGLEILVKDHQMAGFSQDGRERGAAFSPFSVYICPGKRYHERAGEQSGDLLQQAPKVMGIKAVDNPDSRFKQGFKPLRPVFLLKGQTLSRHAAGEEPFTYPLRRYRVAALAFVERGDNRTRRLNISDPETCVVSITEVQQKSLRIGAVRLLRINHSNPVLIT